MISDTRKNPYEPCLGIDAVQFGGFDQGIGDGCGLAAALGADEEVVLPAQSHAADSTLRTIIVKLEGTVFQISAHLLHTAKSIPDRLG